MDDQAWQQEQDIDLAREQAMAKITRLSLQETHRLQEAAWASYEESVSGHPLTLGNNIGSMLPRNIVGDELGQPSERLSVSHDADDGIPDHTAMPIELFTQYVDEVLTEIERTQEGAE